MELFGDIGYLKHCIGVYIIGLVFVLMFIFLNAHGAASEIIKGTAILVGFYTLIALLIFIAMPFLPTQV